jgi:hypothetical protein
MQKRKTNGNNETRQIMVTLLLTIFLFFGIIQDTSMATVDDATWEVTISVTELGGSGDDIIIGETPKASDGVDPDMDYPKPPFPPQLPFISARIETGFEEPFNFLWYEYRRYPNEYNAWDFSVMWRPEPTGNSKTTVYLSWDPSAFNKSEYDEIELLRNETFVADMLAESEYSFLSSGDTEHHFRIVCQSNGSSSNEAPFVSLILIFACIMVIVLFNRKNKS